MESRACLRETFRSVRRMVLPSLRPIVITSFANGTMICLPASSSMISLKAAMVLSTRVPGG
ncbi:MAG: hypothetical protein A2138_23855 [Deltaproteobacteria bacterium RBG_16_71_12]|nr:MAG: hypothetical protein A2138_23855 [Deltaproteobacteria bacterium RBG_16_71_12]